MNRTIVFLSMPLMILFVAGCGGSGDYSSPKATFQSMVAAAKAEDENAMMACFSKETRADLEEMEKLADEMGGDKKEEKFGDQFKASDPVYGAEKINGDKATLEATMKGEKEIINFVKEGGDWKISMPELKMVLKMMKGMGDSMEEMMKGMEESMKEGMGGEKK